MWISKIPKLIISSINLFKYKTLSVVGEDS